MEQEGMMLNQKTCPYEEEWYPNGREICIDGIWMVCINGVWEDMASRGET